MAEIIEISDHNRHQRGRARALHDAIPLNRVRSIRETAEIAGISVATLYRRLKDGTGPRITSVTPGRRGVTDHDREAWLEGCAK
jgi:predicted DNA-binding transcriptional regulator AlpA